MAFIKRSHTISKTGKKYESVLLVKSYRENGKIKHKTLMNLSSWGKEEISAFERTLKGKGEFSIEDVKTISGKSIGALYVFFQIAKQLGIFDAIKSRYKKLAMLLIIGRILTQGSRRELTQWQHTQELQEILGLETKNITLDKLYKELDNLAEEQEEIEEALYKKYTFNGSSVC